MSESIIIKSLFDRFGLDSETLVEFTSRFFNEGGIIYKTTHGFFKVTRPEFIKNRRNKLLKPI